MGFSKRAARVALDGLIANATQSTDHRVRAAAERLTAAEADVRRAIDRWDEMAPRTRNILIGAALLAGVILGDVLDPLIPLL